MTVRFQDLTRLHDSISSELTDAIQRVASSSAFVGGAEVDHFETSFAEAHAAPGAVGCGSGTDALSLTLRALGIGPGDEVVVPAMTFVATAEAVVHVGATPVIADVDPTTLLIDDRTVAAVRSPRTKAIVAVHLYGHVIPFATLAAWRADGLAVVEDAAQAHLATDGSAFVGSAGTAACFSFYPGKNLGAWGDGGAVISHDEGLLRQIRTLRDHGRTTKYSHDLIGWCSRLDGVQAAILDVKLRHLPDWTDRRRQLASRYRSRLGERLVPWSDGAVHHLLVMRVPGGLNPRLKLQEGLASVGTASGIHYPIALSNQPSLATWATPAPEAEHAADEILSLPMDPLMTEAEVDLVCDQVRVLMTDGPG